MGPGHRRRGSPDVLDAASPDKRPALRPGRIAARSSDHFCCSPPLRTRAIPTNFSLFLQLLDADAYADVKSIREAMERRRAPFYLRRTKEAMVYFPQRKPDGTWEAKKIFTKRIPHTVDFHIDGAEYELYREVTRFVKRECAKAAAERRRPTRTRHQLLDGSLPAPLASSTYALRRSLENRASRLDEGLKSAQDIARLAPPDSARTRKNWTRWRIPSANGWRT